jgi:hypothetical protein
MSRSIKQPIYKDKGYRKQDYWRVIRSTINNKVRQILSLNDPDDVVLPNAKEIISDYDYSDYSIDTRPYPDKIKEDSDDRDRDEWQINFKKKLSRK